MKLEDQISVLNIDIQLSTAPVDNHINVTIEELSAFKDVMISSMSMTNPLDKMDIKGCLDTLNLAKEQQKGSNISTAVNWIYNQLKPKLIEG